MNIYPDQKKYVEDSNTYNMIPVFCELQADFETPLSIFQKVGAKFLLESIEQGENVGRYSIIGMGRKTVISLTNHQVEIVEYENNREKNKRVQEEKNPLSMVREYFSRFQVPEYPGLPPFFGGAIGYLGYETVQYFEEIPVHRDDTEIPDGLMIIPEVILVYDMVKRSVSLIVSTMPDGNPGENYKNAVSQLSDIQNKLNKPLSGSISNRHSFRETDTEPPVQSNMKKDYFLDSVNKCKEQIGEGEIIQAVFSQQFTLQTGATPFELYRTLRIMNPSPYLFFLDFDNFCIIGSSPEVMVRIQNNELMLKPIAGTRKRGKSLEEDRELVKELLRDPKERAEHLMLVDLGRNDLGRVAVPGSVEVTDYMGIEKYSHVMHIVSTIKAQLDSDYDVFDVIRATFPAGTLTGAPKIRAMEIISELETHKRGPYGGMVFNLGFNGNFDSCITIRTLVLKDGTATIQAGAGIVYDSDPSREYEESVNKAKALLQTIHQINQRR